jgi:hypothetical protein
MRGDERRRTISLLRMGDLERERGREHERYVPYGSTEPVNRIHFAKLVLVLMP